jgi:hypothetical protein
MIDKTLIFLKDELNAYVKLKQSVTTDVVFISSLVKQSGEKDLADNSLGMMVVSIEEERMFRSQAPMQVQTGNTWALSNPELKLNLFVLLCANYTSHTEALKQLSNAMLYFQGHTSFDNQTYPALGDDIERITTELYALNFEQQNQLWASLGAKYMPSVLYKVRMLFLNDNVTQQTSTSINRLDKGFAGNRE